MKIRISLINWKSVLLCIAMLQFGQVFGQIIGLTSTSSINMYTNTTGTSTIIKNSGEYTVIYNKDYGHLNSHTFFVYRYGAFVLTPLSVTFTTDFGALISLYPYICTVNDIELLGDTCYFCGQMSIDWDSPSLDSTSAIIEPIYQDYGFIGKFALNPVDSNYTIQLKWFENTSNLTRLAVSHIGNNTNTVNINAVGDADGLPTPSCLVVVQYKNFNNNGYQWKYSIGIPTDHENVDVEHLEDVLALSDGFVIVSRAECNDATNDNLICYDDKHYEFRLYKSDAANVNENRLFNTGNDRHTWHRGSERMRLCNHKNNGFCLSYSTIFNPNLSTTINYHAVLAFSTLYSLDSATLLTCDGSHHVRDISFNSYTNHLYVLGVDSQNPDGIVYWNPVWWNHYGYDSYSIKKPNHSIDFIDNKQGNAILNFVGFNTASHILCRYGQNGNTVAGNTSSCFSKESVFSSEPDYNLFNVTDYNDKMDWVAYEQPLIWVRDIVECTSNQPVNNNCSTYNQ